mgnify:CR=1 FL=1
MEALMLLLLARIDWLDWISGLLVGLVLGVVLTLIGLMLSAGRDRGFRD